MVTDNNLQRPVARSGSLDELPGSRPVSCGFILIRQQSESERFSGRFADGSQALLRIRGSGQSPFSCIQPDGKLPEAHHDDNFTEILQLASAEPDYATSRK
jgi:hypothetical protein